VDRQRATWQIWLGLDMATNSWAWITVPPVGDANETISDQLQTSGTTGRRHAQGDSRLVGRYSGIVASVCVSFRFDLGLRRCRHKDRSSGVTAELDRQAWDAKDARKIGRKPFPVHRKAVVWLSAASKVLVRLESTPLRIRRVRDIQVQLGSRSCRSSRAIRHADRQP